MGITDRSLNTLIGASYTDQSSSSTMARILLTGRQS
jgi:hypothetical protein